MLSQKKKISKSVFLCDFKKTLALPGKKPKRPIVLGIAGPARVGKTTLLKYIQKKLPYFIRIANDDIRRSLYRKGYENEVIENFLYQEIPALILGREFLEEGYSIMLDANIATRPKNVAKVKKEMKQVGIPIFIIRAWAPVKVVKRRLQEGKSDLFPDWRVGFQHFERSRKQFDYKKFEPYLAVVNTSRSLDNQLRAAIKTLKESM